MGFHFDRFPLDITEGSLGGPGHNTSVVETDGGESYRVARWQNAKRVYNAKWAMKSQADVALVLKHYLARTGPANGFPFKDLTDYATTSTLTTHNPSDPVVTKDDVVIGTGDASETVFQLVKKYTSGSQTVTRTITLPIASTVKIAFDGVDQPTGWTVNAQTGKVTFTSAPGAGVTITAGFEHDVAVEYAGALDQALTTQIESFDNETMPDILLQERITDIVTPQDYPPGGGLVVGLTDATEYSYSNGAAVVLNPTVSGVDFILPPLTDLEEGDQHIVLKNAHATNTIELRDAPGGTLLHTLAGTKAVELWVYDDSGKKWLLIGDA